MTASPPQCWATRTVSDPLRFAADPDDIKQRAAEGATADPPNARVLCLRGVELRR